MKKRVLSLILVLSLLLPCLLVFPTTVEATSNEQLVYTQDFSSNYTGWTAFGGGSLSRSGGKLHLSGHTKAWYSPKYNLYSKIREYGAGTYWVEMDVSYTGTTTEAIGACLRIRSNQAYSFISNVNGNYHTRISGWYNLRASDSYTKTMRATFKVLECDLTSSTGQFNLCVDGIPGETGVTLSIDNVKVYRMDDTQITNGDFSNDLIGWREWCNTGDDILFDESGYIQYARKEMSGSIACPVDQILSYYGKGIYTVSFDLWRSYYNASNCTDFAVYLSRGTSTYHYLIGTFHVNPNEVKHVSFDFTMFPQLYTLLAPDSSEVFFRIKCLVDNSDPAAYFLDNVSLTCENERPIADGTYFLKNKQTEKCADITNQSMTAGTYIHQWDAHGDLSQRWIFTYLGDGTYSICSANSNTPYYLGVENDSTASGAHIVLRTGTLTDGMKWKISVTASGAYKITALTGEASDYVLSVGWYLLNINGIDLYQNVYGEDSDYKDEWILIPPFYYASVDCFYDNGYPVYYSELETSSQNAINGYISSVSERYMDLFGLVIAYNSASYYSSPIDICKGVVNSSNIDDLCVHSGIIHTDRNNVISSFNSSHSGSNTHTNVLWSCHKIKSIAANGDPEYNRSCSSNTSIIIIKRSYISNRTRDSKGVLMHELNHQFGAVDHYHELQNNDDPNSCKFKDICSECGTNPRPSTCIMNQSRIDISNANVICPECQTEILSHLAGHHGSWLLGGSE